MLKSQDCVLLLKLLAHPNVDFSQRQLSKVLGISLAEINAGLKRLEEAGLLRRDTHGHLFTNNHAAEEFLVFGLKFLFPGKLGEYTRGFPAAIAAPMFRDKIALGDGPIPVWPDAQGDSLGVALFPIHANLAQIIRDNPDPIFHELLILIDVIRLGRPRERSLAITLLKEKLKDVGK